MLFYIILSTVIELNAQLPASAYVYNDSTYQIKKHPWRAGFETIGLNVLVWGFDRFAMNEDFARINFKTIKRILRPVLFGITINFPPTYLHIHITEVYILIQQEAMA